MKLKKNLVLRRVGSKYMIVDLEAETVDFAYVFQMNAVAADLWERAVQSDSDITEDLLTDWLCEEYEVDRQVAFHDAGILIQNWLKYGLIE